MSQDHKTDWIFNLPFCVYILFKRKLAPVLLQCTCTEIKRHTAGGLGCSVYITRLERRVCIFAHCFECLSDFLFVGLCCCGVCFFSASVNMPLYNQADRLGAVHVI